ncbi:MAG TPA: glycosyltransferase family 1 protein [Pantanalinema sp.]
MPKNIMIDAREAGPKPSGLARYTFNLLRGLARHGAGYRYTVLTDHPELLSELHDRPDFDLVAPGVPIVDPREQVVIPMLAERLKPDLFHSPSMVAPFFLPAGCKRVMTLHDTIPLSYPEGFRLDERLGWALYYALSIKPVLARTDHLITVSEFSKQDIVRHTGFSPERISVVYNWLEANFGPVSDEAAEAVRERHSLPERFVLALGSEYKYKNMAGLLHAFKAIAPRHPGLSLVLKIGKPMRLAGLVSELGLSDRVRFLGFVPDDELPALYRAAEVFAFPSFYEGFGLPPLEAMLCGTPVLASTASSVPEVVGDAALNADPADGGALAEALERLVSEPGLREDLRRRGLAQSTRFFEQRGVQETLDVYDRLLGRPARVPAASGRSAATPALR